MKNKPHTTRKMSPPETGEETYKFIEDNAPRKLSVEQLRKYEGYEDVTDEEALDIIESLYKLALLAYYHYLEQGTDDFNVAA